MDISKLKKIVEVLIHAADEPLSIQQLKLALEGAAANMAELNTALSGLQKDYKTRGIELIKTASGYRFQTRAQYAHWVLQLERQKPPKLSRALLETLAIIAYRQPVTRAEIQAIRGVAVSSDIMQRLQEREWVKKMGTREVPGRPSVYGTTREFLTYFSLSSLTDLPSLKAPRDLLTLANELQPNLFALDEQDGTTH